MVKESSFGLMVLVTKDNSQITLLKEKASINGQMVEPSEDNGRTIKCTVLEFLIGLMVESTKESTLMT
jgi:hypothetical protein